MFDKYQNTIVIVVLLFYIFNSIYISSEILSVILFALFINIQLIRMRKQIGELTHVQKMIILSILVTSIMSLVLLFIWLNHMLSVGVLSFPGRTIGVIQITLIITFLLVVTTLVRKLYLRFTSSKA
ncbi:MAG: hypothetical protein ACE3JQ_03715 [Paenisporosarcina sp.]